VPVPRRRGGRASREPRAAVAEPWSVHVAAGRYQSVIEAAERRGLADVYRGASREDLQALADAARYVRRPDIARAALLAIRSRFDGTRAAEEAGFLLGRLEETSGATRQALEWYERYLSESPDGVYAAQALGRKLLLVQERGSSSDAVSVAREYLRRFPAGPYAATARQLLARGR
jgi:hypothetical protein